MKLLCILDIFHIEEDSLKLHERYNSIILQVMLLHDLIQIFLGNVMAYFTHRIDDVVLGDCPRTICVKLVEDCLQHTVVQKLLHVQGRHQELSVVYFAIPLVVYFVYNLINLIVWNIDVTCLNRIFKLTGIYQPSAVLIDLNEFFSELFNLLLVSHFDEHIHSRLLQLADSLK